jgi:hypothetical protein
MDNEPSKGKKVMQKILGSVPTHVYMVRNKKTGKYSNGNTYSFQTKWEGKAKAWRTLQATRSHAAGHLTGAYKDAEIVEMELYETKVHPIVNPKNKKYQHG